MGMYTLFVADFRLKPGTPAAVRAVLVAMAARDGIENKYGGKPESWRVPGVATPDHPFFRCHRWPFLMTMGSAYFDEPTSSRVAGDRVQVQANLKNYDDEIGKFCDWIGPHVDAGRLPRVAGRPFLGRRRYEESDASDGLYAAGGAIVEGPLPGPWEGCTSADGPDRDWPAELPAPVDRSPEAEALRAAIRELVTGHAVAFHIAPDGERDESTQGDRLDRMDIPTLKLFLGDMRQAAGLAARPEDPPEDYA